MVSPALEIVLFGRAQGKRAQYLCSLGMTPVTAAHNKCFPFGSFSLSVKTGRVCRILEEEEVTFIFSLTLARSLRLMTAGGTQTG